MERVGTVHHYGVTVADMEDSLAFYRDTLGLPLLDQRTIERGTEDGERFSRFVGVEGAHVHIAFLDGGSCEVELLEYEQPRGTNANENVSNNDPGASHVCLSVDDMESAYEGLSDEAEFINLPVTLSNGNKVAYLFDPDGNVVEIAERAD